VVGSLAAGVVFGVALAAPPGPMNAVIAEESVLRGWTSGFRAGLGAASADAVFFVLSLLGVVAFVREFPRVQGVMVGVGGVLMLYFAYGAASELGTTFSPDRPATDGAGGDAATASTSASGRPDATGRGGAGAGAGADTNTDALGATGFRKAFVLALTNPYQILFWLTIGVGLLESGQVDVLAETPYVGADLAGLLIVETGSPALIVGFFGGIGVWITGFPATLVYAQRRVDRFAPVVAGASALVLAGFGVAFLIDAARTLL
jgi:threonine/homoserine/homoserine lactone efflux protein